jgi:hypothetical protein
MTGLTARGVGLYFVYDDTGKIVGFEEQGELYIHYCNPLDFTDGTPREGWWLTPGEICEYCGAVMTEGEKDGVQEIT